MPTHGVLHLHRVMPHLVALLAAAFLALSNPARAEQRQAEPEAPTGTADQQIATGERYLISTANELASEAGRQILRRGGSATDAAIAAQLVLGLVEPQSSGLGGGAFIVHWNNAAHSLQTYDGRETAPKTATPGRFMANDKTMDFDIAVHSGLSIGTPGLVRVMEKVHKEHGKLPWADLFEPAIKLSQNGFKVSRRLHYLLRWFGPDGFSTAAKAYFFDEKGGPRAIGTLLKNPDYATTLLTLAKSGPDAFYTGPIAEAIVASVANDPRKPGDLTLSDLAGYEAKERTPLCVTYRTYRICGMGPPSSGGTAIAQIMSLLAPFDLGNSTADAMSTRSLHLIVEAERLAYADRNRYLADPDFTAVPVAGLLDPAYIDERRKLIDPEAAKAKFEAGMPQGAAKHSFGRDATTENVGTSHLSIIDADGNAVSMTTTIEGAFGSGAWAAGFLLNNQLTDFSFRPTDASGQPIANRVEGGKRPRSSMAPTIVFDDKGEVRAVVGSPGGSRIILYVVKALVGLLDWQLDAQQAIDLPNFGSMGGAVDFEYTWSSFWHGLALKTYGHEIGADLMNSGLHVVARRNGRLEGGADPRREGAAVGD